MARVTITRIAVENFGPFRERQTLLLTATAGRPITLIKALNGSGKTTLLTALQVGLYGAKAMQSAKRSDYDATIASFQRGDVTGPMLVEVDLSVDTSGVSKEIFIHREWISKGEAVAERLTVRQGDEITSFAEQWDDYINRILPAELAQLFLFDGEKIEALANPDRLPMLLRRATEVFLGIDGIEALSGDLRALERRTLTRGRDSTSEFESTKTQLEEFERVVDSLQDRAGKCAQDQASARNDLDAAQIALEQYTQNANRVGATAYEQAGRLRSDLSRAQEMHREKRKEVLDTFGDALLPLAWLPDLWSQYVALWDRDEQARIARVVVNELKRRDTRILRSLPPGISVSVKEKLRQTFIDDIKSYPTTKQSKQVLTDSQSPTEVSSHVNSKLEELLHLVSLQEKTQMQLKKAETSVGMVPSDEQLTAVLADMKRLTLAVATAQARLDVARNEHVDIVRSLDHANMRLAATRERMRNEFKGKAVEMKSLEAGARARTLLSLLKDRLLAEKANWLSRVITDEFKKLLHKQNLVSRVLVDPLTYGVSIQDPNGAELAMDRLSAGERHMLAIAVLGALIKERKGGFPVVVDSPLARLDRGHRETLIQRFFASVSHQVLVLSTDEEVDGRIHELMRTSTNAEYMLEFVDSTRSSRLHGATDGSRLAEAA